jgi:hypothetical protein
MNRAMIVVALAVANVATTVGTASATRGSVPKGVLMNGAVFGPTACTDGVTRTFVHPPGNAVWSTSGTKWKLVALSAVGTFTDTAGNVEPFVIDVKFGESKGLAEPIQCSAPQVEQLPGGTLDVFTVSTVALV